MKRCGLIFFIHLICSTISAQDCYRTMIAENRIWNMMDCQLSGWGDATETTYYSILIKDEAEYAGKRCHRAYVIKEGQEERFARYLSEENSAINLYSEPEGGWIKVFDFTLKVGDQNIMAIDTIRVCDRFYRRAYYPDSFSDWGGEYVVEGIGSSFFGPRVLDGLSSSTCGSYLLSVYDGNECIFTKDDFTKEAYHSEPVGINVMDVSNASAPLYDLYGRRLQGEPRKGIYVKGGRKFLRK